jgi:hypothetical protein
MPQNLLILKFLFGRDRPRGLFASKEVAILLNVKVKTAETHRSNIMLKLNLHSIVELVLYAVRNEIVHVQLPAVAALSQPWEWTSESGPAGPN